MISGLHREVVENCALLGYYAATSGNFLQTFRDNLSAPYSGTDNVSRYVGKKLPSKKCKGILRQAEVALRVPVRLRPRIFSTFGTTRVVDRQPNAPVAFTPEEIPGTHFQRLSRPQGTWFFRKEPWKKPQVTPPGIDPGTVRLVAQRLNHYATPGPQEIATTRCVTIQESAVITIV